MRIACLAWGSLVWNQQGLQIETDWFKDGPAVPVEFARQSGGHRLTLVLGKDFQLVTSLWAWMRMSDLDEAIEDLRDRESTATHRIGVWCTGEDKPELIPSLDAWAQKIGADAVIWTALPPKYQVNDRVPTVEEAIDYLQSLDSEYKLGAEEYVRKAPLQVRTPYREEIEKQLGWLPVNL